MKAGLLALVLVGAGCGGLPDDGDLDAGPVPSGGEEDPALVAAAAWVSASEEADPFAAHRAADASCAAAGWGVEAGSLEVDTGACRYLLVEQPLLQDVAQGAAVEVTLWHQSLHAEDDAVAHAALAIGGTVLWEREVAIPSPAGIYVDEAAAPRDFLAGEPVVLHLHNHGANTWNVDGVALVDAP